MALDFDDIADQVAVRIGDQSADTRTIIFGLINGTMRRIALFGRWSFLQRNDTLEVSGAGNALSSDVIELLGRPRDTTTGVPLLSCTVDEFAYLRPVFPDEGTPIWYVEQNLSLSVLPIPDITYNYYVPVLHLPIICEIDGSNSSASPEFPQHVYEWIVEGTVMRMMGRMNHELADETEQRFLRYMQEKAK